MSTQENNMEQIFTIDVKKALLSDKVLCNNGKDWWYTLGYHLSRQQKTIRPRLTLCNLMAALQYRNFWDEVELQQFEKPTTVPSEGEGKYIHSKLNENLERTY